MLQVPNLWRITEQHTTLRGNKKEISTVGDKIAFALPPYLLPIVAKMVERNNRLGWIANSDKFFKFRKSNS